MQVRFDSEVTRKIANKVENIALVADDLPGIIIIHDLRDFSIIYMSSRGLNELNLSLDEIRQLSSDEYHKRYFNPEDARDYVPKIQALLGSRDDEECIYFFQQVRTTVEGNWKWHLTSMRILLRSDDGVPLLSIALAFPVDPVNNVTPKVERLLKENQFLRKHYDEFSKLGQREREVLKLLALGKTSAETAQELFISTATVDTHRKNIKQKLRTNSFFELCEYARAFDLI